MTIRTNFSILVICKALLETTFWHANNICCDASSDVYSTLGIIRQESQEPTPSFQRPVDLQLA